MPTTHNDNLIFLIIGLVVLIALFIAGFRKRIDE